MTESIPAGWKLHEDEERVARINAALNRSGGQCPCVAQWKWTEDTMCPCLEFRSGHGCHCGLYVKD